MTDAKILEVIERYERYVTEILVPNSTWPMYAHILTMTPKMREFLKEGRREKLMRWIGFIQGVLWARGIYTIEELADHNRPDE